MSVREQRFGVLESLAHSGTAVGAGEQSATLADKHAYKRSDIENSQAKTQRGVANEMQIRQGPSGEGPVNEQRDGEYPFARNEFAVVVKAGLGVSGGQLRKITRPVPFPLHEREHEKEGKNDVVNGGVLSHELSVLVC